MANPDGQVIIDTKIDDTGIQAGADEIITCLKKIAKNTELMVNHIEKATSILTSGMEKSGKKVNELNDSLEDTIDTSQELDGKKIEVQIHREETTSEKGQKPEERRTAQVLPEDLGYDPNVMKYIDSYTENAQKKVHTLLTDIKDAKKELKDMGESGLGPGDSAYDAQMQKISALTNQLSLYTKGITESMKEELYGLDSIEGKIAQVNQEIAKLSSFGLGIESPEMQEQLNLRAELLEIEKNIYKEITKTESQRQKEKEILEAQEARAQALQEKQEARAKALQQKEEARLQALNKKLEETRSKEVAAMMEANRLKAIADNAQISESSIIDLNKELVELTARQRDLSKAGLGLGYEEFDKNTKRISEINSELNKYKDSLSETDKEQKNFNKTLKNTEKSSKRARGGISKMLALSILYSTTFTLINRVTDGFVEGMNNLAQYSNSTNKSLSILVSGLLQLKNSLATAFSPILTVITPALQLLINLLITTTTYVSQFISALMGQSTYIKAVKVNQDYAQSLADVGKSAKNAGKDAQKASFGFDTLNQLQLPDNAESGGGGGAAGAGEIKPSEMFETQEIESGIISLVDRVKAKLSELNFAPLLTSFEILKTAASGLADTMGSAIGWLFDNVLFPLAEWTIESALPAFFELLAAAMDVLNNVLIALQPLWEWLWDNFLEPAAKWAGEKIVDFIELLTEALQKFSKWISENQETVQNFTLLVLAFLGAWMAVSAVISIITTVSNAIQLLSGILFGTANSLGIFGTAIAFLTSPIGIATVAISGFIALLVTLAYNNEDIMNSIREAFKKTSDHFKLVYETIIKPVFEKFMEVVDYLWTNHIKPLWENFKHFLEGLIQIALDIYNHVIMPVADHFTKIFGPIITAILGVVMDVFKIFLGFILDKINGMISKFNTFLDFLHMVFELGWDGVWAKIKEKFSLFYEAAKGIVDKIIQTFKNLIEFLKTGFNEGWAAAWEKSADTFKGIFNFIVGIFENAVNFIIDGVNELIESINDVADNLPFVDSDLIPTIPRFHLPRLATGTVVPPRSGEFAAILGDNNRETEVVYPLSTMKQAMMEALAETQMTGTPQNITIKFEGNLSQFVRQLKPRLDSENKRVGVKLVTTGG